LDKKKVSIFWFRRDLRLTDNVGLSHALNSGLPVLPVFIFDENILKALTNKLDARVSFIYHTLKEIDETLQKNGSSLYIVYRTPLNAFKNICEEFNVAQVYTNHDYEPYAINRDKEVFDYLEARHISFHSYKDQVIFEKAEVMKTDGTPYTIFTPYSVINSKTSGKVLRLMKPNGIIS
jgi:deoxyribodipyrimidine photo-lyase